MTEQLLDTSAIASWLDVPELTVKAWRARGGGPRFVKVGRHVRYRRADVERWLEVNTHDSAA
jgi:excisionase family DNA binding protein